MKQDKIKQILITIFIVNLLGLLIIIYMIGSASKDMFINQDSILQNQDLIYYQTCEKLYETSLLKFELPKSSWYVDRHCFLSDSFQDNIDCNKGREYIENNLSVQHIICNKDNQDCALLGGRFR